MDNLESRKERDFEVELETHILQGLELIKQGKFDEALQFFGDRSQAQRFSLRVMGGAAYRLFETPSDESISSIAHQMAARAHFSEIQGIKKGLITLPGLVLWRKDKKIEDPDRAEGIHIPPGLSNNIALLYAEEWLHALQYFRGDRPLVGEEQHQVSKSELELDVARYLHTHGVSLTVEFTERYGRAEDLKGIST